MPRIAVFNQKGGVGKTTTVLNLVAALARAGEAPLAIDLDPHAPVFTQRMRTRHRRHQRVCVLSRQ